MVVYEIDADKAFQLLQWQSQIHNVKHRVLAERVMTNFMTHFQTSGAARRLDADRILLTAHQEVAARQMDGHA